MLHCVAIINSKADSSPLEHVSLVGDVRHTAAGGLLRDLTVIASVFLTHVVFSIQKVFSALSVLDFV